VVDAKTVSNLPVDVSIRWAEDQKIFEEIKPIIQEAGAVSAQVTTEVVLPIPQSQLEILLGIVNTAPTWALFEMPKEFMLKGRYLFRSKLIPFLESDEQQEVLFSRVMGASGEQEDAEKWEKEKILLIQLLKLFQSLNKDLIDIAACCRQYQKG